MIAAPFDGDSERRLILSRPIAHAHARAGRSRVRREGGHADLTARGPGASIQSGHVQERGPGDLREGQRLSIRVVCRDRLDGVSPGGNHHRDRRGQAGTLVRTASGVVRQAVDVEPVRAENERIRIEAPAAQGSELGHLPKRAEEVPRRDVDGRRTRPRIHGERSHEIFSRREHEAGRRIERAAREIHAVGRKWEAHRTHPGDQVRVGGVGHRPAGRQ